MTIENIGKPRHREPLYVTLRRTLTIAIVVGAVIALRAHRLAIWPAAALLVLWPALGGHYVELFYLNVVRPSVGSAPAIRKLARLLTWFVGGVILLQAMILTARLIPGIPMRGAPAWWIGGIAFIAIELIVHLTMALMRQPNFFDSKS